MTPGTRIGPYEIESAIGAGGMGEVYRAKDTKLGRQVAIKSLPRGFAHDPERAARFEREAQVLAALNHAHIAAIYGLEESDGAQFLVLELVEGTTLAGLLEGTGGLGLKESLRLARQIIDALEAAHDKGIIHRDLKPANIAVTTDGQVKVLDFGLAKYQPGESSSLELANSPTIAFAPTQAGVILGTAAYMSPEQAKGRAADRRTDVWAFGCVLFEMLTGKRAFEGDDVSDLLAAVLRGEPDWNAFPAAVPQPIRTLIKRCLEKDRRLRIPDFSVVRFLLDEALAAPAPAATAAVAAPPVARWRAMLPWGVAAALGLTLLAMLALRFGGPSGTEAGAVSLSAELGADASMPLGMGADAVLSPDGGTLVFAAQPESESRAAIQLYVRRLNQLQATALAGTGGASSPFFSPDGQWIGFFAQGKLKKVSVTGGAAVTLCDAPSARGGDWGEDDTIVFQPSSLANGPLQRVSSAGGTPQLAVPMEQGEALQRWPQVLPGAKAVLFTSMPVGNTNFEDADVVVAPLGGGPRKVVQRGGFYGRYLASGHLAYMHQGTLFAVPFNVSRLETTGQPVPVIERMASNPQTGGVQFAAAAAGLAAYVPGDAVSTAAPISWMDQTAKTTPLRPVSADWSNPRFSPDGSRLAMDIITSGQLDVWVYEWARDTMSRLTFDAADDGIPVWTPDGRRIVFTSMRADKKSFNLYWQPADGSGEAQRLTESPNRQLPYSFHPSGKYLAFVEQRPGTLGDLMILPIEGDRETGWKPGKPTVFLSTPFNESSPMFSPDGRWIAYLSSESGRTESYIRPFPGPGGKWQLSPNGGDDVTWSRVANEIFFAAPDNRIMVAGYTVQGDSFTVDKPRVWSEGRFATRPRTPSRDLDFHPDGKRVALAPGTTREASRQDKVVLVFNFFDEVRRVTGSNK